MGEDLIKRQLPLFYYSKYKHLLIFGAPKLYHIILGGVKGLGEKTTKINKIYLLTRARVS